jgi:hypothetical protein
MCGEVVPSSDDGSTMNSDVDYTIYWELRSPSVRQCAGPTILCPVFSA